MDLWANLSSTTIVIVLINFSVGSQENVQADFTTKVPTPSGFLESDGASDLHFISFWGAHGHKVMAKKVKSTASDLNFIFSGSHSKMSWSSHRV
jgi:hypothetical protein